MTRYIPTILVACICTIALVFGLIRMGVSLLLTLQAVGAFDIGAFREPVMEIQQFLNVHNGQVLIPLNSLSYLAIIAMMGLCLVFGAILSWRRKSWGYHALSVYLIAHAGLFVNFQTTNPKINILIGGALLLAFLVFSNQRRPLANRSLMIENCSPEYRRI